MDETVAKLLDWGWVIVVTVAGLIFKPLFSDVKDLKGSHGECKLELEKFKTHVSENYSKEVNTQISLARIHERIDKVGDMLEDKTNEIIKVIMQEKK